MLFGCLLLHTNYSEHALTAWGLYSKTIAYIQVYVHS